MPNETTSNLITQIVQKSIGDLNLYFETQGAVTNIPKLL